LKHGISDAQFLTQKISYHAPSDPFYASTAPVHASTDPVHASPDNFHASTDPVHASTDPVHASQDNSHASTEQSERKEHLPLLLRLLGDSTYAATDDDDLIKCKKNC
jgi:hypothetical protein